jgi:lauroyl/myristoyl acyltransferase
MFYYFLYRLGEIIALYLPLRFVQWLTIKIADIFYTFSAKNRAIIRANLRIILKERNEEGINYYSRLVFRNFARSLVEFFRFSKVDARFLKKFVKMEGLEYFDQALTLNKGIIALTAHLGNWELGGAVVSLSGYPLSIVALPHRNQWVDNFFTRKRVEKGIKVIPLGNSVKESLAALASNRILVLAGDRNFSKGGIKINFFDKSALMLKGIATFSLRLGSPIIPVFFIREKNDNFRLAIEQPIIYEPTGRQIQDLKNITRGYLKVLEKYIRRYPEQWSVFSRIWEA